MKEDGLGQSKTIGLYEYALIAFHILGLLLKLIMDFNQLFPDNRERGETRLRQSQLAMLRMLKIFDYLCTKHEITYFLTGGTLLGAVRHQGFIPWDDDVDVGM